MKQSNEINEFLQSNDYETLQKQVIGTCLQCGASFFFEYCESVRADFFTGNCKLVWQTIVAMCNEFEPEIDVLLLTKELRKQKIKLPNDLKLHQFVSEFLNHSVFSYTQKISIVQNLNDLHLRKNTFQTCLHTLNESMDSTKDIIQTLQETQNKLDCENPNFENVTLDFLDEYTNEILNKQEVMYKSYITPIDKITNGGFSKSDLILLSARPGMGKTEVGIHIAYENAKNNIPILYVSLEMSKGQLAKRIISKIINNELGYSFDNKRLKDKNFSEQDKENILHASKILQSMPLYILDSADLKCENMLLKITTLKRKHKIEMVVLDHLHLVSHENSKLLAEEAVGKISRECKKIAKYCDIPFIALAQLNRAVETRANKRPNNSDLRQSGQLEQDADCIIFLYRDDYYESRENENHIDTNEIEYIFGKNRSGSVKTGYGLIYLDKNTLKDLPKNF